MHLRLLVLGSIVCCGCATMRDFWYGKEAPNGLQQQIAPLKSKEITNELGLIHRDFTPESETSYPKGLPGSDVENQFELRFASLEKGRICFSSTMFQGDNSEPREHLDTFRSPPFVVESFQTLRELTPPRPIYVPASGKLLDDVSLVKDEVVIHQVRDPDRPGKFTDTKRRMWVFRLCGAAPDVTPQTRHITVARPLSLDNRAQIYIWNLRGDDGSAVLE
jgi:hypothetical protein